MNSLTCKDFSEKFNSVLNESKGNNISINSQDLMNLAINSYNNDIFKKYIALMILINKYSSYIMRC